MLRRIYFESFYGSKSENKGSIMPEISGKGLGLHKVLIDNWSSKKFSRGLKDMAKAWNWEKSQGL